MQDITIHTTKKLDLLEFLAAQDFTVEVLSESVFKITKDDDLPVFLSHNYGSLYFQVDLGNVDDMLQVNGSLFKELLDINTQVLPVSFGIDTIDPADPRLVLVESRVTGDLSDNELLSVFDALSIAVDKAEQLLTERL